MYHMSAQLMQPSLSIAFILRLGFFYSKQSWLDQHEVRFNPLIAEKLGTAV